METTINEIEVNGKKYVPKGTENKLAEDVNGMSFVLIRTYSAGVHFGYLKRKEGKEVELVNAQRIWSWSGACSLSQIAVEGVKGESKISVEIPSIILTEAIEIIPITEVAKENLKGVAIWKK